MSCKSVNIKKGDASKTESYQGITLSTIELTKGAGDIKLLPHQLRPIDYLLENPQVKGLLVNHYMGTGKTFLGIGLAQALRDHPVIVLAPKFLESNWKKAIEEYGVYDPARFSFVSYDDAAKLLADKDLSETIILADEVHNLIKMMRSTDQQQNLLYTKVYINLRSAYRILGLTGTPVYGDESDLAFMVNLVGDAELMPFNQEAFRLKYTSILHGRQFFRGYFLESNMFTYILPTFSMLFFGSFLGLGGFALGLPLGILAPVAYKQLTPLNTYRLRKLDAEAMHGILSKYVSFFRFDESQFKEFPRMDYKVVKVPYSRQQYSFFLRLVEGDLEVKYLQRLLKNDKVQLSDADVQINSSAIHENFYRSVGAGRDIGNFEFIGENGGVVEPPKFVKILQHMRENNEQTVIYSNYYETGTKAFARFLERQKYERRYAIIHPDLSAEQVGEIVEGYNNKSIAVLLLHPDVTEGISLKGTRYLHILEPIINSTVLEQVIGRTRRFRSHSHLSKEEQVVNVRTWQSTSGGWFDSLSSIHRANWFKRYRELSYLSAWGIGLRQVDKKYDEKALNPEELAQIKLETLKSNLNEMQKALTKVSIESNYR